MDNPGVLERFARQAMATHRRILAAAALIAVAAAVFGPSCN
ncbi:hypothetical protein [Mycolicibacterium bacteremicum]|nr:hypothetical protein [Mycolicibacterium bacteremicum]